MSRRTVEPKPIYLLPPEIALLVSKLDKKVGAEAHLIFQLLQLKQAFRDDAERVRELVKREHSNGFWVEEQSANGALTKTLTRLKKQAKEEAEAVQAEIAALSPEEMRVLLKQEGLRGGLNR